MIKKDKFSRMYRDDPAAFNKAAEQEAKSILGPKFLESIGKTSAVSPDANPAPGVKPPAPPQISYPVPTAAAINALKSRTDKDVATQQFDKIFGPGAASKILGS
jgi:hypothetical protein